MIVKIACDKDRKNWRWYEADKVQSFNQSVSDWKVDLDVDDVGDFTLINGPGIHEDMILSLSELSDESKISLITFESKDGTPNNIYTNYPAYLLNDDGVTIDKIN